MEYTSILSSQPSSARCGSDQNCLFAPLAILAPKILVPSLQHPRAAVVRSTFFQRRRHLLRRNLLLVKNVTKSDFSLYLQYVVLLFPTHFLLLSTIYIYIIYLGGQCGSSLFVYENIWTVTKPGIPGRFAAKSGYSLKSSDFFATGPQRASTTSSSSVFFNSPKIATAHYDTVSTPSSVYY